MSAPTLQDAFTLFQRGQFDHSAVLCERLLQRDRNDFHALHLRGLIALQTGQIPSAIQLLRQSVAVNPLQPVAHANLAAALLRASSPLAAVASCDIALAQRPDYVEALNNRGGALLELGRPLEALASYERAIASQPQMAVLYCNRGRALRSVGRHGEALASYEHSLRLDPGQLDALIGKADALCALGRGEQSLVACNEVLLRDAANVEALQLRAKVNLDSGQLITALADLDSALMADAGNSALHVDRGVVLFRLERVEEALSSYESAIQLSPQDVAANFNRSNALLQLQRYDEALTGYDTVIRLAPDHARAHFHRGSALRQLGRREDALASFETALALNPEYVAAIITLGHTLRDLGRPEEALRCYDSVLRLDPDEPEALLHRGRVLLTLNRPADACGAFERLLERGSPADGERDGILGTLLHARLLSCDWHGHGDLLQAIASGVERDQAVTLPSFLLASIDSPGLQLQCARAFVEERWGKTGSRGWDGASYSHNKIRLAYVSADFREHPVAQLMAPIFESHDRNRFEVVGVALRPPDASPVAERVRAAFDGWVDVSAMSDREAALHLRKLEIDIAVDLTGYTEGFKPGLFANRAAPVQVNYLGYPGTSGAPYIDYILADEQVIPAEDRNGYTENVVYLPHCYFPYDSRRQIASRTPTRAESGLPAEGFVFCCFNSHHKINPVLFAAWMRILSAVPGSVLWLAKGSEAVVDNLLREAAHAGVGPDRLIFAPRLVSAADHLARYKIADLFLDTLPYNAHTTACDALWAGLPVLTCRGRSFAARVAASMLTALELTDLIVDNLPMYEALAVRLAASPPRLAGLREHLARQHGCNPLFDTADLCARLEAVYTSMWQHSCGGFRYLASVAAAGTLG